MKKSAKVVAFVATLSVLTAGVWFSQMGDGRGDFTKVMQEMQNMQSRIIANNLTDTDLDNLKTAAADAAARKVKFVGWRTTDEAAISTLFTQYGLQTALYNSLKLTIESPRDTYLNGSISITKIGTLLPPWASINTNSDSMARTFKDSTKTTKEADYLKLQKLSKSVNDLSHDIGLMTTFINAYDGVKNRFCVTDDAANNIATLGTVTMFISRTQIKDVCDGSSVKQVACTNNKVILGTDGKPVATATTCPNGCGNGVCLGGSLGALSTVTVPVGSEIKTGQTFTIKAASVSINAGQSLTADITLHTGCTSTGSNSVSIVSSSTLVQYGPITCTTTGSKAFKVDLKSGTSILSTQNLSVPVAPNVADKIEIVVPAIVANTPFSASVTIYGGNGETFTTYNKKFYISLISNGDATFPEAELSFTNGVANVSGLVFATATTGTDTFAIKVVTADRLLEKEIPVTVAAAQ